MKTQAELVLKFLEFSQANKLARYKTWMSKLTIEEKTALAKGMHERWHGVVENLDAKQKEATA